MIERKELSELIARALAEDVGPGDVTTEAVVPEDVRAGASILQKQPGVLYGFEAAAEAWAQAGATGFDPMMVEGQWRDAVPATVARVSGSARSVLTGERVALNLLGHLSGIATLTARYVDAIHGTGATILDTRKTLPGLRALEKDAVAAGGGANHRMGLYDAILIKDNHVAIAGGVSEAVRRAHDSRPDLPIEVECGDLEQVQAGLSAGAERLLLDNMSIEQLSESVQVARAASPQTKLEASGGVNLESVREIAETGVDYISIGALTHSASSLDVSLDLSPLS